MSLMRRMAQPMGDLPRRKYQSRINLIDFSRKPEQTMPLGKPGQQTVVSR
jgi:hypothetical protein